MAAAAVQVPPRAGPLGQPDIDYTPDHDKHLARVARRQAEGLSKLLPPGFPQRLQSDLAWNGSNLSEHYNWNYVLTETDLNEIEAALEHFKCTGDLPLPTYI